MAAGCRASASAGAVDRGSPWDPARAPAASAVFQWDPSPARVASSRPVGDIVCPGGCKWLPGRRHHLTSPLRRSPGARHRVPRRLTPVPGGLTRVPSGLRRLHSSLRRLPGARIRLHWPLTRLPGTLARLHRPVAHPLRLFGGLRRPVARPLGAFGRLHRPRRHPAWPRSTAIDRPFAFRGRSAVRTGRVVTCPARVVGCAVRALLTRAVRRVGQVRQAGSVQGEPTGAAVERRTLSVMTESGMT
jgi:hypothetical protein